jgi:polysaccharide biosynthesis/export protein
MQLLDKYDSQMASMYVVQLWHVRRAALSFILLMFMSTVGLPALAYVQESSSVPGSYIGGVGLAPGDTLEVHFLDFPEASDLHLVVSPAGSLFVPYVGQVKVAGLMPDEAQAAIVEALKNKNVVNNPQVVVTVLTARNLSVMVIGEVNQPHPVPVFSPTPLSAVLSQVSGLTQLASYHVLIAHPDGAPLTDVDLDRTLHNAGGLQTEVRPGDLVAVVRAGNFFAVGELLKPGSYPLVGAQHLTLLQAISLAGGPTITAALSKVRVFRQRTDGTRVEFVIDFAKLSKGEVPDFPVEAEDIIYVPRSGVRVFYNTLLSQALFTAVTTYGYTR